MRCAHPLALAVVTAVASVVGMANISSAIEVHPTQAQVRAAIEQGKRASVEHRPPDVFYVRFEATDGQQASGYLVTKLGGVSVMSAHMALRGLDPNESDIAHVLENPTMLISAVIVGDHPSFAENSYMVLDQGSRVIKPITVRADGQADRSAAWPQSPRFQARVVALFNYADFDPRVPTTISVFPASGGEIRFSVDFAHFE